MPETGPGVYKLSSGDAAALADFAGRLGGAPASVRVAASRLRDAELRLNARDAIIDACIGLEALLSPKWVSNKITHHPPEKYAVLHPVHEREAAAKHFREIYGLRSKLVHGGELTGTEEIGGAPLTIDEAAALVNKDLRDAIHSVLELLPKGAKLDAEFWEGLLLGTSKEDAPEE